MTDKCNKYESLFIFGSQEDLTEHLKICPECRREHEQMVEISSLVREVKPFIIKKRAFKANLVNPAIKIAAGVIVLFLSFWTVQLYQFNSQIKSELALIKDQSVVVQMGLPTDEYGLLTTESGQ